MTTQELKYELNQMSISGIASWYYRMFGEDLKEMYGEMPRKELINELASDIQL